MKNKLNSKNGFEYFELYLLNKNLDEIENGKILENYLNSDVKKSSFFSLIKNKPSLIHVFKNDSSHVVQGRYKITLTPSSSSFFESKLIKIILSTRGIDSIKKDKELKFTFGKGFIAIYLGEEMDSRFMREYTAIKEIPLENKK
jgi:hypothetical protein